MSADVTAITLRARSGTPLADQKLRELVVATANAVAERNGFTIRAIRTDSRSITIDLAADRLAALGFTAELRRLTEAWHKGRTGRTLWGTTEGHE